MPKAAPKTITSTSRNAPYSKSSPAFNKDNENKENANPHPTHRTNFSSNYRSIQLEILKNEVPCYDNAATVRRKLNKLITDKSIIPGTTKTWNKTTLAKEMEELEQRDGAPQRANPNGQGPSAGALNTFLKKTGKMGGGDSDVYYWGYVLLEKLRIHNGEKKSKARLESEEARPLGYSRWDPKKARFICGRGFPPPNLGELSEMGRSEESRFDLGRNYV